MTFALSFVSSKKKLYLMAAALILALAVLLGVYRLAWANISPSTCRTGARMISSTITSSGMGPSLP